MSALHCETGDQASMDLKQRLPSRPRGWQEWGGLAAIAGIVVAVVLAMRDDHASGPRVNFSIRSLTPGSTVFVHQPGPVARGSTIEYGVRAWNDGDRAARDVVVRASVPKVRGVAHVPGFCVIRTSSHPDHPCPTPGAFVRGGIRFRSMDAKGGLYVFFKVETDRDAASPLVLAADFTSRDTDAQSDSVSVSLR